MEDKHRKKMLDNCDKLVKEIDWQIIFPILLKHGIYRREQIHIDKWMRDLENHQTTRQIYLQILKRGPFAFEKFVKCLREINRDDLASILEPEINADQVDNQRRNHTVTELNGNNGNNKTERNIQTIKAEDDNYWTRLQKTDEPLKVVVKKATQFTETTDGVPCYKMRSNPRGLVLIINNTLFDGVQKERAAAEHDEKNLKDLFDQMGFSVQTSRNLTKQGMLDRIKEFSKQPELRKVHSMFVIVMSHGNELVINNRSNSVVCGIDNDYITDVEVLEFFTAEACEDMSKKPKVFIFQTCRGEKVQQAINATNVTLGRDDTDIVRFVSPSVERKLAAIRNVSDMLVAYSTLPGHKAHRDNLTGSWYIQTLCEVMMNHAHNEELTRMFQMADYRLSDMQNGSNGCQTSTFTNTGFHKQCYLNPGYFED